MTGPIPGQSPAAPPAGGATPPPVPAPPPSAPAPQQPATPPAPASGATPPPNPGDQPLGPAGQRALEAEREQNAELRRQLATATAGQTDQQRTEAALAQLQEQLQTERRERLRLSAANGHGIPASHLDLLTATDEAGLEAQAAKIAALLTAAAVPGGTPPPPSAPPLAPLPGQGTPAAPPATSTVAAGRDLYKQRNTTT